MNTYHQDWLAGHMTDQTGMRVTYSESDGYFVGEKGTHKYAFKWFNTNQYDIYRDEVRDDHFVRVKETDNTKVWSEAIHFLDFISREDTIESNQYRLFEALAALERLEIKNSVTFAKSHDRVSLFFDFGSWLDTVQVYFDGAYFVHDTVWDENGLLQNPAYAKTGMGFAKQWKVFFDDLEVSE